MPSARAQNAAATARSGPDRAAYDVTSMGALSLATNVAHGIFKPHAHARVPVSVPAKGIRQRPSIRDGVNEKTRPRQAIKLTFGPD